MIIIHQKGQEAEKKHVQFKVDFAYPPNLLIDIYDIAVILNNALENAIEACRKAEGNKQIKLISNIQRCAKKYMGDIDIVISDIDGRKKFSLTVMMNGKPAAAI